MNRPRIYLGWDAAEMRAWNVAETSASEGAAIRPGVMRLALTYVQSHGWYWRETQQTEQGYYDVISDAPMATGHAIARFLVPHLCDYQGWALFTDGDVLFRKDVNALWALADPQYAVQVVQHVHVPTETAKMTGQAQTRYARKNWSSVMLFHCGHPANKALTVDLVNTVPGRDLHRFCWLDDALIGALPPTWNYLVGASPHDPDPALAHFTLGVPDMPGYEHCELSDEWWAMARKAGYRTVRPPKPPMEAAC